MAIAGTAAMRPSHPAFLTRAAIPRAAALHQTAPTQGREQPVMESVATALDAVLAGVVTVAMGWLAGRFRPQAFGALGFELFTVVVAGALALRAPGPETA